MASQKIGNVKDMVMHNAISQVNLKLPENQNRKVQDKNYLKWYKHTVQFIAREQFIQIKDQHLYVKYQVHANTVAICLGR